MANMDVFKGDAFRTFEMTQAINQVPYAPGFLESLNIFEPEPVRTEDFAIESRANALTIVPTTDRGAPYKQRADGKRTLRKFGTVRIANEDALTASQIQNIRAFGSDNELIQVQDEVLRKITNLRTDQNVTHERMRLGAVQGIVTDADNTVIRNWYTEFGITAATEVVFSLGTDGAGTIRTKCDGIVRATARAAQGAWVEGQSYVMGLASDLFWDELVANSEVRQTYLNQAAAAELRSGSAFSQLSYGGITFVNYRGTDDNSTVAVPSGKCKFFPVNAPGAFKKAMSPGESFDWANTLGQPFYAHTVLDQEDNAWAKFKLASYPLYVCTRPAMLQSGSAS